MEEEKYFFKDNFERLIYDFDKKKEIILFLGAGINLSDDNKTLGWDNLLNSLFEEALSFISIEQNIDMKNSKLKRIKEKEFSSLVKASIIKNVLGDNYINSIQHYLYSRCNKEILKNKFEEAYKDKTNNNTEFPYYTLFQVAKLILLCPNIKAVVTYNYDNFLTEAINILKENPENYLKGYNYNEDAIKKITPKDLSYTQDKIINEFPIYHVHGYIPPPSKIILNKHNEIVLTMEEFYDNISDVFSQQTSTQLYFLSNFTTLFIGISLTDINTQRLIRTAKKHNKKPNTYYFFASEKKYSNNIYLSILNVKSAFYSNYGLLPICGHKGYNKLYKQFNNIYKITTKWNLITKN